MSTTQASRHKSPPFIFVRKFLKHGIRIASITPSSRALAAAMCGHVSREKPQVIVELGAGTGAVTHAALARMHPDSRIIAVEIDPQFAEHLHLHCPRAEIIHDDVKNLDQQLDKLGVEKIDLVLSGLPTPSLPFEVNAPCFEVVAKRLKEHHWFTQITVAPWLYKPYYKRLFQEVRFQFVAANIPPGGVYHCRGLQANYLSHLKKKKNAGLKSA